MTGHLKEEMPIPALMEQLSRLRSFDGQPAKDEWTRRKAKVLVRFLTLQPHTRDRIRTAEPLLGKDQVAAEIAENVSCRLQPALFVTACLWRSHR